MVTLTQREVRELALNLDWGNPFDDPEDIKDSLRTNWEEPLDEESVEQVYAEMCKVWIESRTLDDIVAEIKEIITNHSMTLDEQIACIGYEVISDADDYNCGMLRDIGTGVVTEVSYDDLSAALE